MVGRLEEWDASKELTDGRDRLRCNVAGDGLENGLEQPHAHLVALEEAEEETLRVAHLGQLLSTKGVRASKETDVGALCAREAGARVAVDNADKAHDVGRDGREVQSDDLVVAFTGTSPVVSAVADSATAANKLSVVHQIKLLALRTKGNDRRIKIDLVAHGEVPAEAKADSAESSARCARGHVHRNHLRGHAGGAASSTLKSKPATRVAELACILGVHLDVKLTLGGIRSVLLSCSNKQQSYRRMSANKYTQRKRQR